ncbi:MAG: stringent starvation protein A [Salinisphaeraceae bacterium]|nr:stringent starvation protein A [Salinisphaeraceae bacterium]
MASLANRRSLMTLFSRPECPQSHRVRLVLAEKGITSLDIVELREDVDSEDLAQLNPYNSIPTLVDRDLVLYDPRIIIEYLDERFPHPPLMPVDPVTRARYRLALYRMEVDMYSLVDDLEGTPAQARKARTQLKEILLAMAAEFSPRPYVGEEFSLVDCAFAPILWRLEHYKVELPPKQGKKLRDYADALFARPAFRGSLTELEAEMRD